MLANTEAARIDMELTDEQLDQVAGGIDLRQTFRKAVVTIGPKLIELYRRRYPAPPAPKLTFVAVMNGGIYHGRQIFTRPDGTFVVK